MSQTHLKRKLNRNGVIDTNSCIFNFLIPSLFAAIFSAILQGVGEGSISHTLYAYTSGVVSSSSVSYTHVPGPNRNFTQQGGYQIVGWCLSVAFGLVAGAIIGLLYSCCNDSFTEPYSFFNDKLLFLNDKKVKGAKSVDRVGESGRDIHQP